MTMKKIVWRLKEQPTSEMLRELVKDEILTKDEAREVLFNLEEQTEINNESLKQEIKFLRELVEKLANSQKVVEIVREIERPYHNYRWWNGYGNWTSETSNFSDIKTF